MNRPAAIGLTVFTALCCGLPGLVFCCFGLFTAAMVNNPAFRSSFEAQSKGVSADAALPVGLVMVCVSLILIIIPFVVGFFSLRNKPADNFAAPAGNEPPPVS